MIYITFGALILLALLAGLYVWAYTKKKSELLLSILALITSSLSVIVAILETALSVPSCEVFFIFGGFLMACSTYHLHKYIQGRNK